MHLQRLMNEVRLNTQTRHTTISIQLFIIYWVPPSGKWWRGNVSQWSWRTACGHTLLVIHLLSGINLQKPLTHSDSLAFFSVFSLQQHNYTLCPPQETFPPPWSTSTKRCCFPPLLLHVITGWKSTETHRDGSVCKNTASVMMLHVCACFVIREVVWQRKVILEGNVAGQVGTWGILRDS